MCHPQLRGEWLVTWIQQAATSLSLGLNLEEPPTKQKSVQDAFEGIYVIIWLVISTPLKNISQLGWLYIMENEKNVWNHQLVISVNGF